MNQITNIKILKNKEKYLINFLLKIKVKILYLYIYKKQKIFFSIFINLNNTNFISPNFFNCFSFSNFYNTSIFSK